MPVVSALQKLTLVSSTPARRVTGLRGQIAPTLTGGFGGWTTVARPNRKALTEWDGANPLQQTFSLIFDATVTGPVEDDALLLEQMAEAIGDEPPAPVTLIGAAPHTELEWLIDALVWDAAPVVAPTGERTRHEVTVTLLEHVKPDLVQTAAAAARATVTSAVRTYVVRTGDTLLRIAASQLGDYTRWSVIASLNGIRDPDRLTVGQRLRLP